MTDEELAAIRALLYEDEDEGVGDIAQRLESDWASVRYNAEVNVAGRQLFAEVERLRAENAAMRPIVKAVAQGKTIYYASYEGTFCVLCNSYVPGNVNVPEYNLACYSHTPDCPVTKAREMAAQWQADA